MMYSNASGVFMFPGHVPEDEIKTYLIDAGFHVEDLDEMWMITESRLPLEAIDASVLQDVLVDKCHCELRYMNYYVTCSIRKMLARLGVRERKIIVLRYGLFGNVRRTLEQIGKSMNLTRERVRQLEKKAIERIKNMPEKHVIKYAYQYKDENERHDILPCTRVPTKKENVYNELGLNVLSKAKLSKKHMVYLALRSIGRPAHYSEVAEVFRRLYLHDKCSEHQIHCLLQVDNAKIVWTGIKGTYALKEWGYERPSLGLYKAVTTIVNDLYKRYNKPISDRMIIAEIHKYRQIYSHTSMLMAICLNQDIEKTIDGLYVPKEEGHQENGMKPASRVDDVLAELENEIGL